MGQQGFNERKKFLGNLTASKASPLSMGQTGFNQRKDAVAGVTAPKASNMSTTVGTPTFSSATAPIKSDPAKAQFIQNMAEQPLAYVNPNKDFFGSTSSVGTPATASVGAPAPAKTDPNASYRAAFDEYVRSLQPSQEENAARDSLNRLSTNNRLDYEKALRSGETLNYATGLAGEQARTAAIQEAGAAGSLSALTGQRQAMTEAQKARMEFEKTLLPPEQKAPEGFTLGKDQVRYDAQGNVVARGDSGSTIPGTYTAGANPTVDAYIQAVRNNTTKLENVPAEYRDLVAQGITGYPDGGDPKKQYVKSQADEALTNIDAALGYLSGDKSGILNTAGSAIGRAVAGIIPGSDVSNLNAALDTVKALVGFDALQKMRESSPTGGALGQITERELAFLQSVQGSLNTMQGTEQLTATLGRIRQSFQTLQIVNSPDGSEFELDGKTYIKQGNEMIPAGFNSAGNASASNRPQRNNNPLNIKASTATSTYSGVKGTDPVPASDGGKFLVFESPEAGFAAAKRLIQADSYKNLTVDAAMKRWSNSGYGGEIAPGIASRRISQLSPNELDILIKTMAKREGYNA